ncbi:hypothetical protein [Haloferula sargassicola]|uniref:Uncharacterized protein n=1 Tax=Haloferula sargassicola TaxID=490096 RepID=A0ABP9UKH7_9BACT
MSDEPDPYAPPADLGNDDPFSRRALRELVLAWERLRLLYNVILLIPGIGVLVLYTLKQGMPWIVAGVSALLVAIGANILFFLAPLAELYLRGLFRNGEPIGRGRWLIFGAGLVVSAGVFAVALLVGML